MYTPTQNYGLAMPSYGDEADIGVINDMVTAQVDELLFQNRTISAPPFETTEAYTEGDLVVYENVLYRFTANKAAGAWDSSKVVQTSLAAEIENAGSGASSLSDLTDTDIDSPANGDVLTWDGTAWVNAEGAPTVTKTATGNPIEITDGASAPMVKCETVIQGYQEGSGTPSASNIRPLRGASKVYINISSEPVYNYGFHIDGNKSDPSEMITYLADAVGMTPAHMDYTNDKFDYGSWGDAWFIKDCKPCILGQDGIVQKYLDPNDYTKDIDGNSVTIDENLTGANIMIEFPKIWYKVVPDFGDVYSASVYISNAKLDDGYKDYAYIASDGATHKSHFYMAAYNSSKISNVLRSLSGQTTSKTKSLSGTTEISYAEANGVGWSTEHAGQVMLINFLLMLMGKSTNTQAVFGQGLHTSGSDAVNNSFPTGIHNTKGLFYGTNSGAAATYTNAVKVFGIENWYGFQWRRYRGDILDNGTLKTKLCYGTEDGSTVQNFNTDGTGYVTVANGTPSGTSGQYISQMVFSDNGMFAKTANNTYAGTNKAYCDGYWFNGSGVQFALRGGSSYHVAPVGAFSVYRDIGVGFAYWPVAAAVSYI